MTVVGVGGQQNSYKTALVPITIKGKSMSLFAAIAPTNHLTHGVILGRNLPGMSIKWSLELEKDTTDCREMTIKDETPQVEDTRSKEEASESVHEESSRQEEPKKKVSRGKKKFIVQKKLMNELPHQPLPDSRWNFIYGHLPYSSLTYRKGADNDVASKIVWRETPNKALLLICVSEGGGDVRKLLTTPTATPTTDRIHLPGHTH